MSGKETKYFQFPLYTLAYGSNETERLRGIIGFCCWEMGCKWGKGISVDGLKHHVMRCSKPEDRPDDFDGHETDSLKYVCGQMLLGVRKGTVQEAERQRTSLEIFYSDMRTAHGPSPFVRIRWDLLWDAIGGRLRYREFAVYAAVVSIIGSKKFPVRITRERIIAGALGYKSYKMMTPDVLASRTDGAKPLTEKQVRLTLDSLEERGLFARVRGSQRSVYFSTRMSRAELLKAVSEMTVKRSRVQKNRLEDRKTWAVSL
jgi:hypothetical protein